MLVGMVQHLPPRSTSFHRIAAASLGSNVPIGVERIVAAAADADGLPLYQVYVALAWLRNEGVLRRKGRDSYVVADRGRLEHQGALDELWARLPA